MLIATVPSILYIDSIGRKPALAIGALGMGLCHFIIAIIYAKNEHQWETHGAAGWAAIAMGEFDRIMS
jgi:Sugar (and other) transporter